MFKLKLIHSEHKFEWLNFDTDDISAINMYLKLTATNECKFIQIHELLNGIWYWRKTIKNVQDIDK